MLARDTRAIPDSLVAQSANSRRDILLRASVYPADVKYGWRNGRGGVATALLVAALEFAAGPTAGQNADVPANHPFAFGLEGDSSAPDTKVYDVRAPLYFPLIPLEDRSWGLRLKLTLYAGVYDFIADGQSGLDIHFQSLAATPGVEFLVPVGSWTLKPFTEIGYARDLDDDLGFGVWSFGMRTIVTWPARSFALSFGTKIQYLSTYTSTLELFDDFGEIQLGFDAGHPLGFTVAGKQADFSLYFIRREFVAAVIERRGDDPLELESTNEIGLTFGTTPSTTLWFVKLPRIGLGFRWSHNVRGVRLNFGFPF